MILEKTLSNNFLWFNNFHISTQTTVIRNRVPEFGHVTVKYFIESLKFWMFLKQTLSHIFVCQNGSCILTWDKNTRTGVWSFQSKIFYWNCGIQIVSWNYVAPYIPFLKWFSLINMSLVMQQWNISIKFLKMDVFHIKEQWSGVFLKFSVFMDPWVLLSLFQIIRNHFLVSLPKKTTKWYGTTFWSLPMKFKTLEPQLSLTMN